MRPFTRLAICTVAGAFGVILCAACNDSFPTVPAVEDGFLLTHVIACHADLVSGSLDCERPNPDPVAGLALAVTLGGQGTYVQLTSSNVSYDGQKVFQADVTVQNLIGQPLGTTDGTTLDPAGVRVFFHTGPVVTGGSGNVAVANADGTGTFTGTKQPYFQYDEVLATGVTSAPKTWRWNLNGGVTTFAFEVYVTAEVPIP